MNSPSAALATNPGIVQPWSIGTTIDIAGQLSGLGFAPASGATRVEVVSDDDLFAISEVGSVAFIAKKNFTLKIDSVARGDIPEPATIALAPLALLVCGVGDSARNCHFCRCDGAVLLKRQQAVHLLYCAFHGRIFKPSKYRKLRGPPWRPAG